MPRAATSVATRTATSAIHSIVCTAVRTVLRIVVYTGAAGVLPSHHVGHQRNKQQYEHNKQHNKVGGGIAHAGYPQFRIKLVSAVTTSVYSGGPIGG